MAFSGYFVKVKEKTEGQGDYTFPSQYILFDTYKPIKGVQDLDSHRDGKGVLKRNALDHVIPKVEFQTRPMTNIEFDAIMSEISARYTVPKERKFKADLYIAETGEYTGSVDCYFPDFDITIISQVNSTTLKYGSIRFAIIGY